MRGLVVLAVIGCAGMACVFGKTPDNDWGSVVMSLLFAGMSGALLAAAW